MPPARVPPQSDRHEDASVGARHGEDAPQARRRGSAATEVDLGGAAAEGVPMLNVLVPESGCESWEMIRHATR